MSALTAINKIQATVSDFLEKSRIRAVDHRKYYSSPGEVAQKYKIIAAAAKQLDLSHYLQCRTKAYQRLSEGFDLTASFFFYLVGPDV